MPRGIGRGNGGFDAIRSYGELVATGAAIDSMSRFGEGSCGIPFSGRLLYLASTYALLHDSR